MSHRRLMVPVLASLMVLAAACSKDPPPPVTPSGPTEAELAQMRQDSIERARADSIAEERAAAIAAAEAAEAAERARRAAAARETLQEMVFFEYDQADITDVAEQLLRQKVDILRNSPAVRIRVAGHADERGSNEYNIALANRRAETVREFLTGFGIDESRISIISYGEDRPLVNRSDETAWARNRRAEFSITAGADQINPGM